MGAALSAVRAGARRKRKLEQRRAEAEARAWVLPPHVRHAAILIFDQTGDAEGACKYLAARAREYHWRPEKSDEELRTLVEDLYLDIDAEELAALEEEADPRAREAAGKYILQRRVVAWGRRANTTSGVAPSNMQLAAQAVVVRAQMPEAVQPPDVNAASASRVNRFARVLRRRWGGWYGKLPVREPMTPQEMLEKARVYIHAYM